MRVDRYEETAGRGWQEGGSFNGPRGGRSEKRNRLGCRPGVGVWLLRLQNRKINFIYIKNEKDSISRRNEENLEKRNARSQTLVWFINN